MANLIAEKNVKPDLIISSPALRAYFTARTFADVLQYPLEKIVCSENLYDSSAAAYLETINGFSDDKETVLMFGHNPEITTIVNLLGNKTIGNIPTTGIVEMEFRKGNWAEIEINNGLTVSFEFPKKYLK